MTTSVTVRTHDWPVAVDSNMNSNYSGPERRSWSNSSDTTFVPPNTERDFVVTDTCSLNVRELHRDATSLDHHDKLMGYDGSANVSGKTAQRLDDNLALQEQPLVG